MIHSSPSFESTRLRFCNRGNTPSLSLKQFVFAFDILISLSSSLNLSSRWWQEKTNGSVRSGRERLSPAVQGGMEAGSCHSAAKIISILQPWAQSWPSGTLPSQYVHAQSDSWFIFAFVVSGLSILNQT